MRRIKCIRNNNFSVRVNDEFVSVRLVHEMKELYKHD